jgi:hypothetical protein
MLIALGFRMEAASTTKRQAELARLPPHKLLQPLQPGGTATAGYVYADPDVCHCVLIGASRAYQAFQQLSFQKKFADEYRQTAQLQADAVRDWRLWASCFSRPVPAVVDRERAPPPLPP